MNLYAISHMCSFKEGEVMLAHGTSDRNLFHIISGSAVVLTSSGQILGSLGPGELFGEVSACLCMCVFVFVYVCSVKQSLSR